METTIRNRTIRALSWSLVQEVAQRSFQFGVGILLARLLAPEAFGLIAMVTVITGIAQALLESGFAEALIQRKTTGAIEESSVFYFNIFVGLLFAGAVLIAAPGIAAFYGQPSLISLTRVLALIPVINSFAVVQNALMIRNLDFKRQAGITAASLGVSGAIGVMLAWNGFGVWSLVVQQVSSSVTRVCLSWRLNAWRPRLLFSAAALREMFAFGSGMLGSNLLNTFFASLYPLIIGKLFLPAQLGYYNRAQTLESITSQSLSTIANRVTFPVFAGLQEDLVRFKTGLRKATTMLAFVQFPISIGLASVAKPLILLLLTEKWAPSIPYLQLLCFAGLLYPMHFLNLNVLMALGRSDLFFRLGLIKLLLVIPIIWVTSRWGMMAMIWGLVVFNTLGYFINSYYTKRFVDYSIWDQLRDVYPYLAASAAMGLFVTVAGSSFPPGNIWQLALKLSVGAAGYLALCRIMRLQAFPEVIVIIRGRGAIAAL